MATNSRITLSEFIARRLGSGNEMALLKTMFARSFGASTFADFWRYWNPVYGYYLQYYCYRPLRRFLPRPVAVVLTFAASGFFLHDLPFGWWVRALKAEKLPIPFVAFWFASMGILVLITEAFKLNLAARPLAVRVAVNTLLILSTLLGTLYLAG